MRLVQTQSVRAMRMPVVNQLAALCCPLIRFRAQLVAFETKIKPQRAGRRRTSRGEIDGKLRERRLSAILIADIVGYSRLVGADEAGTLRALNAHRRELIDPTIASHRGRFVRTTGDGLILEFASAVDAVRCAVDVQRGMAERNEAVPPEKRIEYRIGINVGDIISVGDDIYGDGVNIAARLEAMSEPGGIYVSRTVRDPVVDKLAFSFDDLGEVTAKISPGRSMSFACATISKPPGEDLPRHA
jgi:class 3 adenylate cyclase